MSGLARIPQHVHRSPNEVRDALVANLKKFRESVTRSWELAALVESDLDEIVERQLYRTAFGYASFERFCQEELGMTASTVRRRIERAADTERMNRGLVPSEDNPNIYVASTRRVRKLLPKPPIPATSVERALQMVEAVGSPETSALPPPAPPKPAPVPDHPMVTWLCRTLAQLPAEDVLAHGTEEQLRQVLTWVDRFIDLGQEATKMCDHHPSMRSEDGRTCDACGQQVKR